MKMNCIIIDDDPIAISVLKNHINEFPNINVLKIFSNPIQALTCLEEEPIDAVFLDIDTSHMNGLDFLKNVTINPFVIITTTYRKYAVESYDLNVFDYLVKPIPFQRFLKSINKLTQQTLLKQQAQTGIRNETYIFLKVDKKLVKIKHDEIYYIESLKDYIRVFTSQGYHMTHKSLSSIAEELPADQFLRIHRSYVIAIQKVVSVEGNLIEINNKRIPIGRKYIANTKQIILG